VHGSLSVAYWAVPVARVVADLILDVVGLSVMIHRGCDRVVGRVDRHYGPHCRLLLPAADPLRATRTASLR
jgi:hypothetical protein